MENSKNNKLYFSNYFSSELTASFVNMQEQILSAFSPMLDIQTQYEATFAPFYELQEQLLKSHMSQMEVFLDSIHNLTVNSKFQSLIKIQSAALKSLSSFKFNLNPQIPTEASEEFTEISKSIIQDIGDDSLLDISEEITTIEERISRLTIQDVFAIIAIIISILGLVQTSLPDKQLDHIEESLEQLIDIQATQLEMLQQSPESSE